MPITANELHKALSGTRRYIIVGLLLEGKQTRAEILSRVHGSSTSLTQDLTYLQGIGLITYSSKQNRRTYFFVDGVKSGKSIKLNGQKVTYL